MTSSRELCEKNRDFSFHPMANVLLVEDDLELAKMVKGVLKGRKLVVECVHDGVEATERLCQYKYDLIILDWKLPGFSGVDVCRQFRASGGKTPVLMLTGKSEASDVESGLDAGADDYLTKPFDNRVLLARVRALLRRPQGFQEDVLRIGALAVDRVKHTVSYGGKEIHFPPKEFALLDLLLRNRDHVLSSEAILDRVWTAESDSTTDSVRTAIKRLRDKLSCAPEIRIRTVHSVGYRLEIL